MDKEEEDPTRDIINKVKGQAVGEAPHLKAWLHAIRSAATYNFSEPPRLAASLLGLPSNNDVWFFLSVPSPLFFLVSQHFFWGFARYQRDLEGDLFHMQRNLSPTSQ